MPAADPSPSITPASVRPVAAAAAARDALIAALVGVPWVAPWTWGPSISALQTLVAAACAAVLLALVPGHARRTWPLMAAALCLAALLVWRSPSANAAMGVAAALWLFVVGVWTASDARAQAALCRGLVLAALLNALAGGIQLAGWSAAFDGWVSASTGVVFGNLRQRNQFATLMATGLACTLALAGEGRRVLRLPAGAVVAALAAATAASSSRTGALLLLAVGAAWLGWSWRTAAAAAVRRLLGVAALAYAAATVLVFLVPTGGGRGVIGRLAEAPTCQSRRILWSNVIDLIGERPVWGWGWGRLDHAHWAHAYDGARFCEILDNAHNLPLHLAVELGVPVAVLGLGALAWLGWRARPWRDTSPMRRTGWLLLALVGLHSLLEYPLWYAPFQLLAGLACGLLLPGGAGAARPAPAPAHALRAGAAAAALLVVVWVGWNYRSVSQAFLPAAERIPAYRDDPLGPSRGAWMFDDQRAFAELSVTRPAPANACPVRALALRVLDFSPEPRVVESLIESAWMTGHADEAERWQARYAAAYPEAYARWQGLASTAAARATGPVRCASAP